MVKYTYLIVFSFLSLGCSQKQKYIYYEYEGTYITRIDYANSMYFYYGKCKNDCDKTNRPYIVAKGSDYSNSRFAFLGFNDDKSVTLSPEIGKFTLSDTLQSQLKIQRSILNSKLDTIYKNPDAYFDNYAQITDNVNFEKELNLKGKTKVKISY